MHGGNRLLRWAGMSMPEASSQTCLEAWQGILPLVAGVSMLHVQLCQLVIEQLQEVCLHSTAQHVWLAGYTL